MAVWAIADLHLCFGTIGKSMEAFGPRWHNYVTRIEKNWSAIVQPQDLVLIAGDISWAMKLEEAQKDLEWIDKLPGTKVMIRGNHDYWWGSLTKVRSMLPPSLHVIQHDVFNWEDLSITGTRLWDTNDYSFNPFIEFRDSPPKKEIDEKIFLREIERLTLGLRMLDQQAKLRIVMTHYPPISADLQPSIVSRLFEEYNVNYSLFGHLHQLKEGVQLFGERNGIRYILTAADFLGFEPKRIL